MLKRISPYPLWVFLSILPVLWMYQALTSVDPKIIHQLLHPTGEMSARLLIITMMISPLALLFKQSSFVRWLRKNRRYFGVASFVYALLHTVFYLIDRGVIALSVNELSKLCIWTGWIAFLIFVPLAVTSMDYFVRKMGPNWKTLQRTTYVAAAFTLLHWASLHKWEGLGAALVHFTPLIALEAYRMWYWWNRRRQRAQMA